MISFGRFAPSVALVLFSFVPAVAQNPAAGVLTDPIGQFILAQKSTSGYRGKIQAAIVAYEKGLDAHCKNVSLDFDSGGVKDTVLAPLYTNEKGVAVAGSWRETVPGTACGEPRNFNVRVDATLAGLQFAATFPGDAAGDPDLQKDTLKNIESTFEASGISTKKDCHLEVIGTHLIGPEPTLQENGNLSPWKETWDVRTCGTVYSVPIAYASDGKGTFIEIHGGEIKPE